MDRLYARRATVSDATALRDLLASVGTHMLQHGFANWAAPYSLAELREDIATRLVVVVFQSGALCGSYMLGMGPKHAYDKDPWPTATASALYLNRMAVSPEAQQSGIGRWMLSHIAATARDASADVIRCDVLADNLRLCRFYERAGYVRHGDREHSGWRFACYQYIVPTP